MFNLLSFSFSNIFLFLSILIYLIFIPFTKVEESFNIQAIHDIITYNINISLYDHNLFPGVVPRTFIGSIIISFFFLYPNIILNILNINSIYKLLLCRSILGLFVYFSLINIQLSLKKKFTKRLSELFILIIAFQFHIPFYSTRTLPNTFAMVLTNHAFAAWLNGNPTKALFIIGCAMTIFRCDLLILVGSMALWMLLNNEIKFLPTLFKGILVCLLALATSVLIDSYFWNKWLWPEGIVLFFNTVENKSSEWGVSPWHWYFTSAIPRGLQLSFPLVFISLTGLNTHISDKFITKPKTIAYYLVPYILFVSLYSILPHKELRFIFPVFAPLTFAAAAGLSNIMPDYKSAIKSAPIRLLFTLGIGLFFLSMIFVSSIFAVASIYNYPGGEALTTVHKHLYYSITNSVYGQVQLMSRTCTDLIYRPLIPSHRLTIDTNGPVPYFPHSALEDVACLQPAYVNSYPEYGLHTCDIFLHIDAAAAISGITRFQELKFTDKSLYQIHYSKNESKEINFGLEYDWLIRGIDNQESRDEIKKSFDLIFTVYSFSGYQINWRQLKSLSLSSYLLPEESLESICQQHEDNVEAGGEDSTSVIHRPFFGPLHLKFKQALGIYRNKRIIKYPIEYKTR